MTDISYYESMFAQAYTDGYPWGYRAWRRHVEVGDMTVGEAIEKILRSPTARKYYPNMTPQKKRDLLNFFVALYLVDRIGLPESILRDWSIEDYVQDNLTIGEIISNEEVVRHIVERMMQEGYSELDILEVKKKLLGQEEIPLEELIPREMRETLEEMQEAVMEAQSVSTSAPPPTSLDLFTYMAIGELPFVKGVVPVTFNPPQLSTILDLLERIYQEKSEIGRTVGKTGYLARLLIKTLIELRRELNKYNFKVGEGEPVNAEHLREQLQALTENLSRISAILNQVKPLFEKTLDKWLKKGRGKTIYKELEKAINMSDEALSRVTEVASDIADKYREIVFEAIEGEKLKEEAEEKARDILEWWSEVKNNLEETLQSKEKITPIEVIETLKQLLEQYLPDLNEVIGEGSNENVAIDPLHLGVIIETLDKLDDEVRTLEAQARQEAKRKEELEEEINKLRALLNEYKEHVKLLEEQLARQEAKMTPEEKQATEDIREELEKVKQEIMDIVTRRETNMFTRVLEELEKVREEINKIGVSYLEEELERERVNEALNEVYWTASELGPKWALRLLDHYVNLGYKIPQLEIENAKYHIETVEQEIMEEKEYMESQGYIDLTEVLYGLARELGYNIPSDMEFRVYGSSRFLEKLESLGFPSDVLEALSTIIHFPAGTRLDYYAEKKRTIIEFPNGKTITFTRVPISTLLSIKEGTGMQLVNIPSVAHDRLRILQMLTTKTEFTEILRLFQP